jgi:hypothetical protein
MLNCHSMPPCISQRKLGPDGSLWATAAPLVRPHPSGPASRLPSRGRFLGGPGPLPRRCSAQVWCVGGLSSPSLIFGCVNLLYALPDCAFCLVFHLHSNMCPVKHVFSNTSGTRSMVYAYVS